MDERLKGLPALKEQVVNLHQSLNQPHLAIPGKKAGTSYAFVVGLRGPSGFAVFVYLYLPEAGECAVYVPSAGTVPAERFQQEEGEALAFVESMGFIMDNVNFRARPPEEQDAMIRGLPVFQREPPRVPQASSIPPAPQPNAQPSAPKPTSGKNVSVGALGKLFSAFCVAFAVVSSGCAHVVTEKDKDQAQIRYELAVQLFLKDPQAAYKELDTALGFNPNLAEAYALKGILLHTAFHKLEEAQAAYQEALKLKPALSEAHTNLGNVFMDLKRYDDAIREYDTALSDVLYGAQFIAHGNKGWAHFKKGESKDAMQSLKAALTLNPKYCLGHLQLGQVYEKADQPEEACKYFTRYRENCAEQADAYEREGLCQLKQGKKDLALKSFETCVAKATDDDAKERCKALQAQAK